MIYGLLNSPTDGVSIGSNSNNYTVYMPSVPVTNASNSIKIGHVDSNGNNIITFDTTVLKRNALNSITNNYGMPVEFSNFSIQTEYDEDLGRNTYYLLMTSKDNYTKTSIPVHIDNNNFMVVANHGTCTCNGCRTGCQPHWDRVGGGCSCNWACTTCSKSETISRLFGGQIEDMPLAATAIR